MAPSIVEKRALGFSDFPGELRNMIYEHLLVSPFEDHYNLAAPSSESSSSEDSSASVSAIEQNRVETNATNNPETASSDEAEVQTLTIKPRHLYPAILATCRAINTEATPLLYGRNTFTATVTAASLLAPQSPALLLPKHRHVHHTRFWNVVIDFVASTPLSWSLPASDGSEESEDSKYLATIDDARDVVEVIKTRVKKVCRALKHLKDLQSVKIQAVSDFGWQNKSRVVGLGMAELLEEFKNVTVEKARIEGAAAVVRKNSILDVGKTMTGNADFSDVDFSVVDMV